MDESRDEVASRVAAADRLDGLAEVAELMDDVDHAIRLRQQAAELRMVAMRFLDD